MPTYEYECAKCGLHFEQVQPMSAAALTICPKEVCGQKRWGKGKVKRAIGAGAGLIFKGSGFYITDYRSENYKSGAKKDATAGESKPAAEAKPAATLAPAPAAKKESKSAAKKAAAD